MRWSEALPDTNGRSWLSKTALWERAGDLEQARRACEASLASDPTQIEGWLRLARIHQLEGSEATAVAVLQAATRAEPGKGRLWKALGQAALRAGDGEMAYLALGKAIERNEPGSRDLARILTSWHQARGENSLAERAKTLWATPTK